MKPWTSGEIYGFRVTHGEWCNGCDICRWIATLDYFLDQQVNVENNIIIFRYNLNPGKGTIVCQTFDEVVQALTVFKN